MNVVCTGKCEAWWEREVGGRGIWGCVQGKMVALAETIAWIKGERFFSAKQKSVEKLW